MATATTTPVSVIDYIRSLTDEEKEVALIELVDEAIRLCGDAYTIPIKRPNGELLAYFVPPAAAEANLRIRIPKQTPEQLAATQAALANLHKTFDAEVFFEQLSREDPD